MLCAFQEAEIIVGGWDPLMNRVAITAAVLRRTKVTYSGLQEAKGAGICVLQLSCGCAWRAAVTALLGGTPVSSQYTGNPSLKLITEVYEVRS